MKLDKASYWIAFGHRLRVARVSLQKSEAEAAAALRVSLATYRTWESGGSHRENHYGVFMFSKTMGVDIGWLVGGPEHGEPPRPRLRCVA